MERRVQLDIDYIQRWSPELDVRIILRTIAMVFRDEKAY
jgi:putative colanic acid biosynthesis UDP-glucose lipid carrier transferase